MQNVVHNSKCDSLRDNDINDSTQDRSGSSSSLTRNTERGPSLSSLQSHFMAEISESDDDDVSEVESFILEQDIDEDTGLDSTSKFLLAKSTSETVFDSETTCRLEALLEASNHLLESSHFDASCSASTSYSDRRRGRKITDVAREFDIAHSVVSRLWKSIETTGMCSRLHGGGRVRSMTPAEDRYIVLSAKRNRRTTAQQVANQFLAGSGKQISRKTVARCLRGGGLYARRPVVCVPLTRQHRIARLQWCREHHNWTEQDWACVLFSDESRFSLSSDCRRQLIWRESGTAYRPENIPEKDRYPTCSIMVWAGIMINGRMRLHVVANGTMTGQRYIDEVLLPHVRLFRGAVGDKFVFMDDNATCHRTLAVQDCLDSEGIQRLVWPVRSPDLNPIENVWDALGRQVAGRNYPPTNKNTLIRALTEEWDKLPQQLLDNVVQSDDLCDKKFEKCAERLYWEKLRQSSLTEACTNGDISTVKKLLEEGRSVNEITEDGESLLSLAASSGYYELAQLLLAMKANVEDRGLKDMTPLMEAANAGNTDIVKLLIQHGADVNAQTSQEKKLKGAKVKNHQDMKSQQEMHGTIPGIVCPEGNTPLMFACAAGHEDIVRILLDAGARVEDHNENGHTPLMEAASAGHVEVAKLLVERGASINTHSNEFKESALTLACYKGSSGSVLCFHTTGPDSINGLGKVDSAFHPRCSGSKNLVPSLLGVLNTEGLTSDTTKLGHLLMHLSAQ
ncbi:ankyrin repeat domain-containing protein 17 [Trichonephila clavipes]|nr:ankyrin repeat domain-containing protein 17 [Trichonephila clavipes]